MTFRETAPSQTHLQLPQHAVQSQAPPASAFSCSRCLEHTHLPLIQLANSAQPHSTHFEHHLLFEALWTLPSFVDLPVESLHSHIPLLWDLACSTVIHWFSCFSCGPAGWDVAEAFTSAAPTCGTVPGSQWRMACCVNGRVSAYFSRADWQWSSSSFRTWNPLINSALPNSSTTVSLSHITCALVLDFLYTSAFFFFFLELAQFFSWIRFEGVHWTSSSANSSQTLICPNYF